MKRLALLPALALALAARADEGMWTFDNFPSKKVQQKYGFNPDAKWLQERLKQLGQQALTAERAVNSFKSQNNIVAAGGKLMDEQQVGELNTRLVTVRAQTSEALTRLNRLQTILTSNSADSASIGSLDGSGSEALANPIINLLGVLQTVPSLVLLGLLIPFLGIGQTPALFAAVVYSLFPIDFHRMTQSSEPTINILAYKFANLLVAR